MTTNIVRCAAKVEVARASSNVIISLYWSTGQEIVERQFQHGWGDAVVEQLSKDLKESFPDSNYGFSPRNLWDMRRFYLEYKDYPKLRQLVAEIPWGQNLLIINKLKDYKAREYYLDGTRRYGWTRAVLQLQIKSNAFQRHVETPKQHNFKDTFSALTKYFIKGMIICIDDIERRKPSLDLKEILGYLVS